MKTGLNYALLIGVVLTFCSCNQKTEALDATEEPGQTVEMVTNY